MKTTAIKHEVWIDAPIARVYGLLSSAEAIGTWWDEQTQRDTPDGVVFEHSPGEEHGTVQFLVVETRPNELVKWRCISEHPPNVPASEWTGTEIVFQIGARESSNVSTDAWARAFPIQSVLRFEHRGWPEDAKYLAFCSFAWSQVLRQLVDKAVEREG